MLLHLTLYFCDLPLLITSMCRINVKPHAAAGSSYNKPSSVPHSVLQPQHHCTHCHQTLSSLALTKPFYDYSCNVMLSYQYANAMIRNSSRNNSPSCRPASEKVCKLHDTDHELHLALLNRRADPGFRP